MKNQYQAALFESLPKELIVTVPAVWSERAKDLTLKAVSKADFGAQKTWIVTEPEVAAVYALRDMMHVPRDVRPRPKGPYTEKECRTSRSEAGFGSV